MILDIQNLIKLSYKLACNIKDFDWRIFEFWFIESV